MSAAASPREIVCFGEFEADLPDYVLCRQGVRLRIAHQPFKVLAILLEHAGQVVTREELRRNLWPEAVYGAFENDLNTVIARLRAVLGDSGDHPRFIETIPKRGYRFIGNLSRRAAARARLLVLPFTNLSGDLAHEHFCDGFTDEIIGALAGLAPERLAVIARTTAMHYKGSAQTISQIVREVAVDYVVEGGVRRSEDRLVASVQLIRVSDESHLWASRYDVDLREVFNIESAAAQAIVAKLGINAQPAARKPTEDLHAYDLYTQGRHHMYTWTPQGVAEAKHCFERAIARDPRFAAAYESLAELCWYLGFFGFASPRETCSTGIFYALRALEIDQTLAETHAILGMFRKELDFNWLEVRREMGLALELNPNSPVVRVRNALATMIPFGHITEAITEIQRALEFDPLAAFTRTWLGLALWVGRQYDRALEQGRILLELNPNYYMGHFVVGAALQGLGEFDEAVAAQRRAAELSGASPAALGWLGLALAQNGDTAEARALLDRFHGIAREAYVPPASFAWIYAGLGEVDSCFEWMDRAIDARDHMIVPIRTYPFLDSIRADARYFALLRRMNLEP